ncbi:hypothetical protein BH10PSE16_BH10PSE16_06710 [soil metagenome]
MTKTPGLPPDSDKRGAKAPNPAARKKRKGQDFGLEGTNKTLPVPQPDAQPADELQGTKSKFIPKTPYTRG